MPFERSPRIDMPPRVTGGGKILFMHHDAILREMTPSCLPSSFAFACFDISDLFTFDV